MSRRPPTIQRDTGPVAGGRPGADDTRFFPPTCPSNAPRGPDEEAGAGEVNALSAAIRFLVRNVRAREAEAHLELLLRRVVSAMREGLFICDERGLVVYVNERFCRMVGRSREELVLQPAGDHFLGIYSQFLEARDRGERECHFGCDWRASSGESHDLRVRGELVESDDHKYLGCYGIVQDLTGRAQTEAALTRSQSQSALLSAQLLAAQEAERQRIAGELHEGIGQALGSVKFGLEACAELISSGDPQTATGVARLMVEKIQSALEEVRRISMDLHPSTLDDLGVLATIGWLSREFQDVYPHLELQTSVDACEGQVPRAAKTAIYRIMQEALNNVALHAQARTVSLSLKAEGGLLELVVQDDGIGFDPAHAGESTEPHGGFGLVSMRQHAESTGGQFTLDSAPGCGTTIRVVWPDDCPRSSGV